ncbi:MAG: GDSL-type esterase/lipase family protein [Lachnospiraceae bacterium]
MKFKKFIQTAFASVMLMTMTLSAGADEVNLETTEIFSGESKIESAWTLGPSLQTTNGSGSFDPTEISKDGYFTIEYTGTEGAVYLALSEWTTSKWASINEPDFTEKTENGYISTFLFQSCADAYGSEDMSDVDAISVGSANATGETVITNISWHGYPVAVDLGETAMLYKGSAVASKKDTNLTFFYTKHVGGEWDAAQINEGSYIYVEYIGAEEGVYLAFASASGATGWVAVYPDETGVTSDGRYYSLFKYDNFSTKFGTNFTRLDQIQAYSAKNEEVTLKRIAYFAGTGAPVDTGDGTWDRPAEGIAFIGDSIVQNPLVDSVHLGNIDWNGILGRDNCVNYGIGGQTTKECSARIDELAKKNYDKVVMLCGINDIGRGYSNEEIAANYETMFTALIKSNPDIKIFLISVLPTTPVFYTNAQDRIVALDETLKALADEYENVTYVDCYSSFVGDNGYCREELVFDGLHPSLDGYQIIADILNPYLDGTVEDVSDAEETPDETQDDTNKEDSEQQENITDTDENITTPEQDPENADSVHKENNNSSTIIIVIVVALIGIVLAAILLKKKKK